MILTDREIQIALERDLISIEPRPSSQALSSTSIDLTLAGSFARWTGTTIRPGAEGYSYHLLAQEFQTKVEQAEYTLEPRSFVLGWTREKISIPVDSKLAARVEGKSSLARLGVGVHVTAPTIHSGFEGQVQLEIFNFGPHTITLDAGMRVCQLIFELTTGTPDVGYKGIFAKQVAGKKSRTSDEKKKSRVSKNKRKR